MAELPTKKGSELPLAAALTDNDVFFGIQGGITKRFSVTGLGDVSSVTSFDALRAYAGRADTVVVLVPDAGGLFYLDPSDTSSPDDGGVVIVTTAGRRWKRLISNTVNPMMFGAVPSRTVNSTEPVRKAFAYAEANNKRVTFAGLPELLLDRTAMIQIRVPTDFSNFKPFLANTSGTRQVFQVQEDPGIELAPVAIADQSTLKVGQNRFIFSQPVAAGLVYLNSTREVNSRVLSGSVSKVYYRQVFSLDRDGLLNNPLEADFTTGSEFTLQHKPFSPTGGIKISNLSVDDSYGQDQGILEIKRSLTVLENVNIPASASLNPSTVTTATISVNMAAKCVLRNCYVSSRPATNIAQYAFAVTYAADTLLEDCSGFGQDTWGTILTSYTNGLKFVRCKFKRFDAHESFMNWTLENCETYGMPVQWGFGYGYLKIDGMVYHNTASLLRARPDYGGDFKGSIDMRGVTWRLRGYTGSSVSIFDGPLGGNNFVCDLAHDFNLEDMTIEYDGALPLTVFGINTYNNQELAGAGIPSLGFRKPRNIKFDDIRASRQDFILTNTNIFKNGLASAAADKTTTWTFTRVQSRGYKNDAFLIANSSTQSSYPATSIAGFDKVFIDNCPDVMIQLAKPGVDFYITDVPMLRAVSTWRGASAGGALLVKDCIVDGSVGIPEINLSQGEIGSGSDLFTMYDTTIKTPVASLAAAKALQGVTVLPGVTVTWPAAPAGGVAANAINAFTGWRNNVYFQ